VKLRPEVKKTAMITIATRSSTTARVSRNARSTDGSDVLMTARTASANAMSVAVGTAQPWKDTSPATLTRQYTSAGTAIPHSAATTGNAAADGDFSSPATSSRFSSIPATKKKIVSSPSDAQWAPDRWRLSADGPKWKPTAAS
jgi:hypothetical protein